MIGLTIFNLMFSILLFPIRISDLHLTFMMPNGVQADWVAMNWCFVLLDVHCSNIAMTTTGLLRQPWIHRAGESLTSSIHWTQGYLSCNIYNSQFHLKIRRFYSNIQNQLHYLQFKKLQFGSGAAPHLKVASISHWLVWYLSYWVMFGSFFSNQMFHKIWKSD